MWTKNWKIRCDECNKFCVPYDEETPFGCKDSEYPEPLDPYHYCKKCAKGLKKYWLNRLKDKKNWHYGYYQKSKAEMWAAEKLGLKWSNGIGLLSEMGKNNPDTWAEPFQYITEERYNKLNKLPYWGYCKVCGAKRKGGYCSVDKCKESFKNKTKLT